MTAYEKSARLRIGGGNRNELPFSAENFSLVSEIFPEAMS